MARKSDPLAFGGLALLTLIWSFSWIAMKQVTSYIGAFDFHGAALYFWRRGAMDSDVDPR